MDFVCTQGEILLPHQPPPRHHNNERGIVGRDLFEYGMVCFDNNVDFSKLLNSFC